MSSPSIKLNRLRGLFVVYFVLKSIAGAVLAAIILKPAQYRGWNFSKGSLLFFSLMVAAVILAVALVIFAQLLLRRNWARVLLLVVAWLTVLSAVFSLLATARISDLGPWIMQWLPDMDWQKLMNFDRFQKVFELIFWGYLISVLQFDNAVRDEFFPQEPSAGQAGEAK